MDKFLQKAVSELPELYQPLYGINNTTVRKASRLCSDRLDAISRVISQHPSDAPNILDVGCAQGYMSFGISEKVPGSVVLGIDNLEKNINVCKLISERIKSDASFLYETLNKTSFSEHLKNGYDVVLLLNVIHHLCTHLGAEETKEVLEQAAGNADFVLIELASKTEELAWVQNALDDTDWLSGFHFVAKIGDYCTHLSDQKRSLYFCSNRYALIDSQIFEFTTFMNRSHAGAFDDSVLGRRYYLSSSVVVKKFNFFGKLGRRNKAEFMREIRYLQQVKKPRLLATKITDETGLVAREFIQGTLLSNTWQHTNDHSVVSIFRNTLNKLAELEKAGFYHHDLRPWNILVLPDGNTELIDFGAVNNRKKRNCFEDVLSLLSWLYTENWCEGILAELGIAEQKHSSIFQYVRRTATKNISYVGILTSIDNDPKILPRPDIITYQHDQVASVQSMLRKAKTSIKQIQTLTEWATSAEKFANAKVQEIEQLNITLETQRQAAEIEQAEAVKQVQTLTEWATSAEKFANAKVQEIEQLNITLETQRQAAEIEQAEAVKQVQTLTEWATSAEKFAHVTKTQNTNILIELDEERQFNAKLNCELNEIKRHWLFGLLVKLKRIV